MRGSLQGKEDLGVKGGTPSVSRLEQIREHCWAGFLIYCVTLGRLVSLSEVYNSFILKRAEKST